MCQPGQRRRPQLGKAAAGLLNLGYAAMIAALALTPTPPRVGGPDWLLHGIAFGVQAALLHGLFRNLLPPVRSMLAAGAAAIVYGGIIEVLQLNVPGRFCEVTDLLANAGGVALSTGLLALSEWRRRSASGERLR